MWTWTAGGGGVLTLLALQVLQPGAELLHQGLNARTLQGQKRMVTARYGRAKLSVHCHRNRKALHIFHVSKEIHYPYLNEHQSLKTIGL